MVDKLTRGETKCNPRVSRLHRAVNLVVDIFFEICLFCRRYGTCLTLFSGKLSLCLHSLLSKLGGFSQLSQSLSVHKCTALKVIHYFEMLPILM